MVQKQHYCYDRWARTNEPGDKEKEKRELASIEMLDCILQGPFF